MSHMFHIFLSFTLAKWAYSIHFSLGVTSFLESVAPGTVNLHGAKNQDILSDYPYNHATLQSASYAFLTYSENYLKIFGSEAAHPQFCASFHHFSMAQSQEPCRQHQRRQMAAHHREMKHPWRLMVSFKSSLEDEHSQGELAVPWDIQSAGGLVPWFDFGLV